MKLKWYGHASLRITSNDGLSIITDPYTPELAGYSEFTETADIVIASSDNDEYHCRMDLIPGDPVRVNAVDIAKEGMRDIRGINFEATIAMEMLEHPYHDPTQNAMYRFEVDGIKVAHMGDVGNDLNNKQVAFFEGVDILLTLAGGVFTTRLEEVKRLIDTTKPKLVIPMHFRTLTYRPRNTMWIESFLGHFKEDDVDFAFGATHRITKDELPDRTRVLVMDYVR